jgi:hypothetical protein
LREAQASQSAFHAALVHSQETVHTLTQDKADQKDIIANLHETIRDLREASRVWRERFERLEAGSAGQ